MDDVEIHFEESWGALQTLIQEGKVRYGGLSNHPVALMERVLALGPIASNQHQYNLLNREIERDVLPFSQEHNIGVLCWSPLASGFLVDTFDLEVLDPQDFRRKRPFAQEPTYTRLKQLRKTLQSFAHDHNRTLFELAIAWILRHPAVTGAIIGIRSAQEARQMLNGCDWSFTDEDIAVIDKSLLDWDN